MTAEQFRQNTWNAVAIYRNYAKDMRAKEILCAAQWAERQANDLTDMLDGRRPFPERFGHFAG